MFYLQSSQAPVAVRSGGDLLLVPKFPRRDFKGWGAEVAAENAENATAGMTAVQKSEYATFYANFGLDLFDWRKIVRTPEGAHRVCRTCLLRAKVKDAATGADKPGKTEAEVDAILEASGTGPTVALAWVLSDLDDAALFKAPKPEQDGDGTDPLTPSAKPGSSG